MIAEQLRKYIITPVLDGIGYDSDKDATELLILTAAQESHMGKYIHQLGNGPACGVYQMEPATHDDIWVNYLKYKSDLSNDIERWNLNGSFPYNNAQQMNGNAYYATAMARAHYLRVSEPLPSHDDVGAMARYWKRHWNTYLGAGTVEQAVANYKKYGQ